MKIDFDREGALKNLRLITFEKRAAATPTSNRPGSNRDEDMKQTQIQPAGSMGGASSLGFQNLTGRSSNSLGVVEGMIDKRKKAPMSITSPRTAKTDITKAIKVPGQATSSGKSSGAAPSKSFVKGSSVNALMLSRYRDPYLEKAAFIQAVKKMYKAAPAVFKAGKDAFKKHFDDIKPTEATKSEQQKVKQTAGEVLDDLLAKAGDHFRNQPTKAADDAADAATEAAKKLPLKKRFTEGLKRSADKSLKRGAAGTLFGAGGSALEDYQKDKKFDLSATEHLRRGARLGATGAAYGAVPGPRAFRMIGAMGGYGAVPPLTRNTPLAPKNPMSFPDTLGAYKNLVTSFFPSSGTGLPKTEFKPLPANSGKKRYYDPKRHPFK